MFQLILRKSIKIVATRCQILRLKCTKFDFDFGSGSAPDPAGSLQRPPDLLAGLEGPTSKGGEGREGKGEGMRGEGRKEKGGEGVQGGEAFLVMWLRRLSALNPPLATYSVGTCEASRFEFESDVPIRIRFESDVPIRKFRICRTCRVPSYHKLRSLTVQQKHQPSRCL